MTLDTLISGHERFKESFEKHRGSWTRLAEEGQHPHTLWIGCSDSRVIPEQITAARPGEIFVLRNVANVVPPYGTTGDSAAAVLNYAASVLGVQQIIVCGHSNCGGVGAVLDQRNRKITGPMARWLSWIAPALSQVAAAGFPEEERYLELIKANVLLQRANVESYPGVREAVKNSRLVVHGWYFDLETGELIAYDETTDSWQGVSSLKES